ncbi:Tad domain-containing protein [Marinobacter sediminum]|uniref:pilus assembly protein TadG-related protein n=1 Tax=Marinobacter sediminum TaxID=256323 RepID=UPI002030B21B|nr:Tad domain-containing protein [Marinobacter sediminum]MCM0612004.1 Tad domain-containing protein [Marinobacter sediminum]
MKAFGSMPGRNRGAYLAMMALLMVVLIGVAALALDVGRVLVLRMQMQNAADAAALAAAVELNGRDGARERARAAARDLLEHDSGFAEASDLLGERGLPDDAITFFCVIGSNQDVEADIPGFADFCGGGEVEPNKFAATSDAESHYVQVRLDPELATEEGRYTLDLIFLPVLQALGEETLEQVELKARAVAGRTFFQCNYPPMAICDPFESSGGNFRDDMPVGGHIQLKQQGANQWTHGNFGFLEPLAGGPGASDVALYLADEGLTGCQPPIVTTKTGNMTNKTAAALNTRMDDYGPPAPFNSPSAPADWPPAPNVMEYPPDQNTLPQDGRYGTGDWDFMGYWNSAHPGLPAPNGWNNAAPPSRWQVYSWEIDNGQVSAAGQPDPSHVYTGDYPPPVSNARRRLFHVAMLSCEALGLTGGKRTAPVFGHDGFAKIFMMRKAEGPPVGEIYGEYVGWGDESEADYHVDVQLYE